MVLPKLDEICHQLLSAFLVEPKPFRFNAFYRFLNEKGVKISKPTLILHLRHLIDFKLVERNVIDKQNITYSLDQKFWEGIQKYTENKKKIIKHFEGERKRFDADTPLSQVYNVHIVLILRGLFQLKYEMLKIAEPDKAFQHNIEIILYRDIWEHLVRWLLINFKTRNEQYRKDILDTIEELIKTYTDLAFKPNNQFE